jgi:uncharacterized membrane protein (DUF4010 family)
MTSIPFGILVATLGGLAVGVEREWSGHASGPQARFGGIRTFALLGGLAGIAGWLWTAGFESPAMVLLAGATGLVVVAYVAASRSSVDATTEVSALVVLAAGVLAGTGQLVLASATVAVTALFLVEKSALHALVARINDAELRSAARFAVMAVVILPVLPAGPLGGWANLRPRELWILVLLCSGLSFSAYVARRLVGDARGYPLAGLLGGLISSTSVTLLFARLSRQSDMLRRPLAAGVIAACTVLFIRVMVAAVILNPPLAWALVRYLAAPFAVGAVILSLAWRAAPVSHEALETPRNPLGFWPALQMAALFQVVLIAVDLVGRTWGGPGVIVSGAVLGLTDIDALTISMARAATTSIPVDVAARAIAVGILSNTALKVGLVVSLGVAPFKTLGSTALVAMAATIAGALVFWH